MGAMPRRARSPRYLVVAGLLAGCADLGAAGDPEDGSFLDGEGKADGFGIRDKTPDALGVLRLVNDADRSLYEDIGISTRATDALLDRRAGDDGLLGTADDRELTSLTRLDGVPWVGRLTFEALYLAARERGYLAPFALGLPAAPRVVAIGDLHGDLDATRRALRLAGAIDDTDHWIGGALVIVQTGDVLDRGDGERDILELLDRLEAEAAGAGGAVVRLLGNHELMNAQGDFHDVTPGGFAAFADIVPTDPADPRIRALPKAQRGRAAAFLQGGPFARDLARHDVVAHVGDTLFVHGGLTTSHVSYGLERIDYEARAFLLWDDLAIPALLDAEEGPLWIRAEGEDATTNCAVVERMLDAAGARRLVIGHTVQDDGITSACDEQLWRIDVGMSRGVFGGPIQVLEVRDSGEVEALTE